LTHSQFYNWRKRYLALHPESADKSTRLKSKKKFHRVKIQSATGSSLSGFEIHYPHGVRVVISSEHPVAIEKVMELIKLRVYQDHLPFYRQIEIFRRRGMSLAPATVNGWFCATVDLLEPLYHTLKKEVLSSDYIQIDETTIPVMDKDHPGATKKGYHWIIRAPEIRKLYFHYDEDSRARRVAIDILKDFKGAVQSDGYGAYDIYETKKDVLLLGCWAHVRKMVGCELFASIALIIDRSSYCLHI
jgi:hypothetical protein